MLPLSASDLLDVWERGAGHSPADQGLVLLAYAFPHAPLAALTVMTVGQRDACLLRLHGLTFGPRLHGVAACPDCGERLELTLDAADLLPAGTALPDPEVGVPAPAIATLTVDACAVSFRPPTLADLENAARTGDPEAARLALLEACLLDARREGQPVPLEALSAPVLEAVGARLGAVEPLADLTLAAACPVCGYAWQVRFDIVSFFWGEVEAWAIRLLHEVHALASAYGWPQAEILALSPWRRQRYLELVGV